jgi:hypothetical protein
MDDHLTDDGVAIHQRRPLIGYSLVITRSHDGFPYGVLMVEKACSD